MENLQTPTDNDFLYARIASRIESQIRQNVLKTGDKLLSVRALSQQQGISMSTAYKAYVELENLGIIEARPKSGYYVRFTRVKNTSAPKVRQPAAMAGQVSVEQMIDMVYKNLSAQGVLKLSVAAPGLSLIPRAKLNKSMIEAISKSPDGCIGYEDVHGNLALRKQIAKYAFGWGVNINDDEVITTQGCMEALLFCLRAVTQPGDTVAIESPTYFGIFNIMKSLGLKVLEIPVNPATGIDMDYLENAMNRVNIKACLFVTNFNNPAGSCMPDDAKQRLVKLVTQHQIPFIEDDIYGEMHFGKSRPRTCKSYDTEGWVMLCSSVSKTLAPGYRVGWCIPGRFKEQILSIKMMHTITSATPTQAAIALFFETGRYDLHIRNLRKALYTQCLRYMQAIATHFPENTKMTRPQGGYVLWVELDKRLNAFELYQAAMAQNISIAPGQIFSTDARYTNFVRISFGLPFDALVEHSFVVLGKLIRDLLNAGKRA